MPAKKAIPASITVPPIKKPVAKKAVVKPVAAKPVVKKPAAVKLAAQKVAVKKPVVKSVALSDEVLAKLGEEFKQAGMKRDSEARGGITAAQKALLAVEAKALGMSPAALVSAIVITWLNGR
jgi:hypothetical protein